MNCGNEDCSRPIPEGDGIDGMCYRCWTVREALLKKRKRRIAVETVWGVVIVGGFVALMAFGFIGLGKAIEAVERMGRG